MGGLGHVYFAGGGTAGHLFPGLAVADRLIELLPHVQITFVGSGKQSDRAHVTAAEFDYLTIACRPFQRRPREFLAALWENYAGYRAALRLLKEEPASVVVGLGGYASVPLARAAIRRGVPLVLLEQNAVPGRATRWLARSAQMVCATFEEARSGLPHRCPMQVTGNPLRRAFEHVRLSDPSAQKQIVVLGGSQGARSLNQHVPHALNQIRDQLAGWQIIHQSGEADCQTTAQLYQKLNLVARVVPFITDMADTLAASGLAVCRAGGTTLAELAAMGVPAVLIPYPHATNDHQRKNAAVLAAVGAAILVDDLDNHLAQAVASILSNPDKQRRMSAAMLRWAHPHAACDVAKLLFQLTGSH